MGYVVRTAGEDDWERVRDLRLEMLRDSPQAYLETAEDLAELDEAGWRFRAAGHGRPPERSQRWVAEHEGEWVATASAFVDDVGVAHLVAVYVRPDHRGTGVAQLVVSPALAWGRDVAGVDELVLLVVETNARALAFYRREGWVETGRRVPYQLDPSLHEVELAHPVNG
jgi:GNAT superfamily N-acetyltransferase